MPCKVCDNPKSLALLQEVYLGKKSYVEASKELGIPKPTVFRCFSEHWDIQSDGEKIKVAMKKAQGDVAVFVDIIKNQMQILIDRLNDANTQNLPFEPRTEKAYVTLTKEVRGIMRDILEFEGKLTRGIHVKYNILSIQFNQLTSFLFANLCEDDRQKLIRAMPELTKIGPDGKTPMYIKSTA